MADAEISIPPAPAPSSPAARAAMRGNRARDTKPEVRVRKAVHALGLRYRKHARPLPDLRCQADLIFPTECVAVFVDGCFWHGCPQHGKAPQTNARYWEAKIARNVERDRRNDARLTTSGWTVIRVWEHEDPVCVAEQIRAAVYEARCG